MQGQFHKFVHIAGIWVLTLVRTDFSIWTFPIHVAAPVQTESSNPYYVWMYSLLISYWSRDNKIAVCKAEE